MRVFSARFFSALLLCFCQLLAAAAATADAPSRVILPDEVVPVHYRLHITPDAANLSFKASVAIEVEVREPVSQITLNALNLEFEVSDLDGNKVVDTTFDKTNGTATLTLQQPAKPGHHTLNIAYSGTINQTAAGLFAFDYQQDGKQVRALYTQFEAVDARQMVPSWDEPALKATFDVSATIASTVTAVSNMPIVRTEPAGAGLQTVYFSRSPRMSTYLLFFAMGDFERISKTVNGIDVSVITRRGDSAKGQFALDSAVQLIPYYEEYFGVKYPLPKLDMLAAPGASQFFDAMENWGAIFYLETALLLDPAISTDQDLRSVYNAVAHEIAHQWFGNLVTMSWWDDLWLNEGFASWMTTRAMQNFYPEWQPWLAFQSDTSYVMYQDARQGTHPIVQPVRDAIEATQAFDGITYTKGQAVIRMLETTVGEAAFRDGVRAYMNQYAYGNTVTDDLWRAVDSVAAVKITSIAHDFTLQAGVPVIDVVRKNDHWQLSQSRLANDDSTPADRVWQVPVHYRADSAAAPLLIVSRRQPAALAEQGELIVNPDASGYYRVNYDPVAFALLVAKFETLSPQTQLVLINDSQALGYSGDAPLAQYLAIFEHISPDMDPIVLDTLVAGLADIDELLRNLPEQTAFRDYTRTTLQPLLKKIGWHALPGEHSNVAHVRDQIISTLGTVNDTTVLDRANAYFADYLVDKNRLPAELKNTVLNVVAEKATAAQWQALYELALSAQGFAEQESLYTRLGYPENRALAEKALQLSLDTHTPITIRPSLLLASSINFRTETVAFALANYAQVMNFLDGPTRNQFIPAIMSGSYETAMIDRLDAYAEKYLTSSSQQTVAKARAKILFNVQRRELSVPQIKAWLESQH